MDPVDKPRGVGYGVNCQQPLKNSGDFMDKEMDLGQIMQSVAEKSLRLLNNVKPQSIDLPELIEKYIDLTRDFQALLMALLKNPDQVLQMQTAYWQDMMGLVQDQMTYWLEGRQKPSLDKRFSSEEWVNHPFFNLMSQQYILTSEHLNSLLEHLDYGDKQTARRIQFLTRQYLDAISPDNFFHTNPQLIAETIQSHGKNLLLGLQNLLSDLEVGPSRLLIKMTDMEAFKVGENIAATPGKVIFQNGLMQLIQYTPQTLKVSSVPLLIIPPWINKYYILDLSPHNSLIRWLVTKGITVFVISWVNPDASYANKGIYDYLNEGPIAAIDVIQKQLQVKQINLLGFCIGGTLLALLLAYYKSKQINPVRSATFLAALIDFSDPGDIAVFIDEAQIKKIEERMSAKGYLEGHFMASAFNSLRASDLVWSFFIKHYLRGKTHVPFDILYWNADATNMPATMHSQYLRWMYLHNDLIKPGKIHLNKIPIDVTNINIPTFFVSTSKDHIAPWKTTYLGFQLMQGEKHFLLGGSGHIAGIIVPPGSKKYGYYRNVDGLDDPNDWLAQATHHEGSWWLEWFTWLKKKSGRLVPAPDVLSLPLKAIEDAPGSYVQVKCS
jgi:polyhydroxyalkanoate synthase